MALTFPSPKSNWEPLGLYRNIWSNQVALECPGAHWCPDPCLAGDPPGKLSTISSGTSLYVVWSAYRHVGVIYTTDWHYELLWLSLCKFDQPVISAVYFDFQFDFECSPHLMILSWWFWFSLTIVTILFSMNCTKYISKDFLCTLILTTTWKYWTVFMKKYEVLVLVSAHQ